MRIVDILRSIQENFYLALIGIAIVTIFLGIGYFFIYKKLLKGDKKLNKKKLFIWTLFIGYLFMVLGVTFIGRGLRQYGDSNLHFFSSYRQAWNSFSAVAGRQLILNIIMLVPFGILVPLLNKKFHKFSWTILAALILTMTIEIMQLLTGYGVFDLDDIFNNILGAIIGYGIIMALLTLIGPKEKKFKKTVIYLLPLISIMVFSIGLIEAYNSKEFGNIYANYNYKINMKDVEVNLKTGIEREEEITLDSNKYREYRVDKVPIYKVKSYDIVSGEEFFKEFLKGKNIKEEVEIDPHDEMVIYKTNEESAYHMWFYLKDGTYDYTDFSIFNEGIEKIDVEKETLIKKLNAFGIYLPQTAVLEKLNDIDFSGEYKWNIEKDIDDDYITDGSLICEYYNDETIKKINNNIVTYKKIKDIEIKSKEEIYREIKEGNFNFYDSKNMRKLDIEGMKLDYILDTKGYYQPIYKIDVRVNGEDNTILMPGIQN